MDHTGESFKITDKKGFYKAINDLRSARPKRSLLGKCMYWGMPCSSPIRSHSISRSWLEQIAEDGHVNYLRLNVERTPYEPVKVIVDRIGIKEASVFPGFCNRHDSELFEVIEDEPFAGTDEQLHLLAYRSICREACVKYQVAGFMQDQGMIQDDLTPHGVRAIKEMYWAVELMAIKQKMEESIANQKFTSLNHFLIRLEKTPQMLVSTSFIPLVTATGRELEHRPNDRLTLNIVPTNGGGFVVFSWLKDAPKNANLFVKSLRGLRSDTLTHLLVNLSLEVSDNVFFSPEWWKRLGSMEEGLKQAFARNLTMGDDTPPADLLSRLGRPLDDWKVGERRFV